MPPIQELRFDLRQVSDPITHSGHLATEILALALPAIDAHSFTVPIDFGVGSICFGSPVWTDPEVRRHQLKSWLLAQAFHQLAKGLRFALEVAYQYIFLASRNGQIFDVNVLINEAFRKANAFSNDVLVKKLTPHLSNDFDLYEELESFTRVRNCLEHRDGVVTERDVSINGKYLILTFPTFIAYTVDAVGAKVEVPHDGDIGDVGPHKIVVELSRRTFTFSLGERVEFSQRQLVEMLTGYHLIGDALARSLHSGSTG